MTRQARPRSLESGESVTVPSEPTPRTAGHNKNPRPIVSQGEGRRDKSTVTDSSTNNDRVSVSLDNAISRLEVKDGQVHTFRSAGPILIGADWELAPLIEAMRDHGVEESGPAATEARHGLVLTDEHGPLFIETREAVS